MSSITAAAATAAAAEGTVAVALTDAFFEPLKFELDCVDGGLCLVRKLLLEFCGVLFDLILELAGAVGMLLQLSFEVLGALFEVLFVLLCLCFESLFCGLGFFFCHGF